MQTFQGGRIYDGPGTAAVVTVGALGTRYAALGGPGSVLGWPVAAEAADATGMTQRFEHGGLRWDRATNVVTVLG